MPTCKQPPFLGVQSHCSQPAIPMSPLEVAISGPGGHIPQADGAALISTDHLQSINTMSAAVSSIDADDLIPLAWHTWPQANGTALASTEQGQGINVMRKAFT